MRRRDFFAATVGSAAASIASPVSTIAQFDPGPDDGVGTIARFGVLTPDFDPVPESELWAMAPRGISFHAARVVAEPGAGFVARPAIDDAVGRLLRVKP